MKQLNIENLTFAYESSRVILNGIRLQAEAGERIAVIGANGAGKTTLLKLMVGLLNAQEGSVSVGETVLSKATLAEVRRRIGYVFQDSDSQLFMPTVYDDIAFGPRNYGYSEEEVKERVERAMELTGCTYLRSKAVHKMSGGEKKIVAIATILALDPDIIIMDEPSNSLDPKNRRRLIDVLNGLDCMKLIATHDLDMVWDCCDRVVLISNGSILADGPVREILTNEELLTANSLELPLSAKLWMMEHKA